MPSAWSVLNAFGLKRGLRFAGREVHSALGTHEEVKRFQHYRYAITVTLVGGADRAAIPDHFEPRDVVTQFGTTYRCTLELVDVKGSLVRLVAHAHRV
jgi:hypothetical protein